MSPTAQASQRSDRRVPVVLMTGDPRSEERGKGLPPRFLSRIHQGIAASVRRARGADLVVASESAETFTIRSSKYSCSSRGHNLADKIQAIIDAARAWGYDRVLILAGDAPGITTDLIEQAIVNIVDADAVVAPSRDGGFSILGLRTDASVNWHRIEWFTERALGDLHTELRENTLPWTELPPVDDVDDLVSAERIVRSLKPSSRLRAQLFSLLFKPAAVVSLTSSDPHSPFYGTSCSLRAPPRVTA